MSNIRRKRPSLPPAESKQEAAVQEAPIEIEELSSDVAAEAAPLPEPKEPEPEAEAAPELAPEAEKSMPKPPSSRERDVHIAIMDETFMLIDTIYRSRHTLLDILAARGYDIARFRKFSPAEAAEASTGIAFSGLSFTTTKLDDVEATCQVYYGLVTPGKKLLTFLEEHVTDDASEKTEVIIMQQTAVMDRHHQAAFQAYHSSKKEGGPRKIRVSYFCIDNLVINPLNHVMVPKHEIVPEEEHKALLTSLYAPSKTKLPEIKFHVDPIARCIGAKPGDIIKITRPSSSAGEAVIYRVCSR